MNRFLCLHDFELAARRRLPRCIHGYIEGAAEDGQSLRANRAAFEAWAFAPRTLVDTSGRSSGVRLFGRDWAAPFGIAPMGAVGVAAFQGDLALARAAAQANIPFVLSGSSLVAMERVIEAHPGAWFQAYLAPEAEPNLRLLARAADCGFETLVITLDVPVAGNREADLRNGYSSPLRPSWRLAADGLRHPRWLLGTLARSLAREGMPHFENLALPRVPMLSRQAQRGHRRDSLGWPDLRRLREHWRGRLVLKGLLCVEDVRQARAAGVDGVVVSNHGGRQLDGAVAPLRMLPALAAEAGSMALALDGGVRRGSDVLKALALGASMVFLGRPMLYAAVAGGQAGVQRAIELLRAEIDRNLALLGCKALDELPDRVVGAA